MMRRSLRRGKYLGISRSGHHSDPRAAGAHLIEEGKRARLSLQDRPDESSEGRFNLTLNLWRQPEAGNSLDVEASVGAEELQCGER